MTSDFLAVDLEMALTLTLELYFFYVKSKSVTSQIPFTKKLLEIYHNKVFIMRHVILSGWAFYGGHFRRNLGFPSLYFTLATNADIIL